MDFFIVGKLIAIHRKYFQSYYFRIMTPDQLLDRMLKYAASPECPADRKREVENGAWKTWANSITEHNPFSYDKVKHEKIHYIEGYPILNKPIYYSVRNSKRMTAADWIQRRKDIQYKAQLKRKLFANKEPNESNNERKAITNESKKKPVINIITKEIYPSCTEAAIANNMNVGTFNNYLLKKHKVRPKVVNFAYLCDYEKPKFKQIERVEPKPFSTKMNNYPRFNSKKIINLDTKQIYDNLTIFCNETQLQPSGVSKYLKTKDRKWLLKKVRQTLNIMYHTDYQLLNK